MEHKRKREGNKIKARKLVRYDEDEDGEEREEEVVVEVDEGQMDDKTWEAVHKAKDLANAKSIRLNQIKVLKSTPQQLKNLNEKLQLPCHLYFTAYDTRATLHHVVEERVEISPTITRKMITKAYVSFSVLPAEYRTVETLGPCPEVAVRLFATLEEANEALVAAAIASEFADGKSNNTKTKKTKKTTRRSMAPWDDVRVQHFGGKKDKQCLHSPLSAFLKGNGGPGIANHNDTDDTNFDDMVLMTTPIKRYVH